MSIKESRKRASGKSLEGEFAARYVVPESTIRDFVCSLGIHDIEKAATRLQAVADATSRILEHRIEQLNPGDLRLILHTAAESKSRRYQQIMKAIIAGVGQGPDGIKAAHLTADRAVELAFRWTSDYVSAIKQYRDRLRENRLVAESRQSTTPKPQLRLVSNSR